MFVQECAIEGRQFQCRSEVLEQAAERIVTTLCVKVQ